MGLLRFFAATVFCLAFAGVPASADPPPRPTIEQLAAYPNMSAFDLSPDGRHLAALQGRGEQRVILVWETERLDQPPEVIGSSEMKIVDVFFVGNDTLGVQLFQPVDLRLDETIRTFVYKLFFTDLEGRNWREPLPLPRARSRVAQLEQAITSPTLLDDLPNDPDHVLLVNNVGVNAGDVFRVNIRTNRAERIIRQEDGVAGYTSDLNGVVRARIQLEQDSRGPYIATEFRADENSGWEEHFRSYVADRDTSQVVAFAADPNIAFVLSNVGRDRAAIFEYDIAQRQLGELLFEHRFFEASDVVISRRAGPRFGQISGLEYNGPRGGDIEWVSASSLEVDAKIRNAFNLRRDPVTFYDIATGESAQAEYDVDLAYDIIGSSADLGVVIFSVSGPNQPPIHYLMRNDQVTMLAQSYPDIDPRSLGTTRFIYYPARDGLMIPGFLTTPNTELCGEGPWSAVVHPHGGPWARDDIRFDGSMWVPLMASRCYAVLQPQYRGSDGWSRRLWTAGDAQWGGRMQDDKDDGAQWLVDNGIARDGHIAMFGFSYGGYAAMAAAVRPEGHYRCAIAGAGVSDIRRIWKDFYTSPFFRAAQAPTVDGLSPLDRADQIQIPIMVYHGVRDQIVPIEQSEWYVSRARNSGQPVVYHEFDDYAHGPAWTREIFGDQLRVIEEYFQEGCNGGL